jgi:hypothetical protein
MIQIYKDFCEAPLSLGKEVSMLPTVHALVLLLLTVRRVPLAWQRRQLRHMVAAGLLCTVVWSGIVQAHDGRAPSRPDRDITVANLNILHGFACDPPVPDDGDQCRVKDRIALLVEHLIATGCPDIVTLQENVTASFVGLTPPVVVGPLKNTVALLRKHLSVLEQACGFRYQVVFDPEGATDFPAELGRGMDEELILTRYPVLHAEVFSLYSPLAPFFFRHVLFARIAHEIEPVDVFTTHLQFVSRGWLDSHLAAQHGECDPTTGRNCTAGRKDENLSDPDYSVS